VATIRQLANSFLLKDESQIIYYENRIKEMPLKVLTKHGIVSREGPLVSLNVERLDFKQRAAITRICDEKLNEFINRRGLSIWDYRLLDSDPVPDSLRYRVLKESGGRCALCGATSKERPLDVDHIIPRSLKGQTVYENLQVLCSKCNRSKRNKDATDFRSGSESNHPNDCLFCIAYDNKDFLFENDLFFAFSDNYPVTEGHTLIIPKRHVDDYFMLSRDEQESANVMLQARRKQLVKDDDSITGFNVGANIGNSAGQTIDHCHIHLIPRRYGDTENPKGGVRGVIPTKMGY
jgi:ATP adenylyltransferase